MVSLHGLQTKSTPSVPLSFWLQVPFCDFLNHSPTSRALLCHDEETNVVEVRVVEGRKERWCVVSGSDRG